MCDASSDSTGRKRLGLVGLKSVAFLMTIPSPIEIRIFGCKKGIAIHSSTSKNMDLKLHDLRCPGGRGGQDACGTSQQSFSLDSGTTCIPELLAPDP